MFKFIKTRTHGKSSLEMQLRQRAAPQFDNFRPKLLKVDEDCILEYPLDRDFIVPQFGTIEDSIFKQIFTGLDSLANLASIDISSNVIDHVENIVALGLTLQGCRDYTSMSAAVIMYLKRHVEGSLLKEIMGYIRHMFEIEAQDGIKDEANTTDWAKLMVDVRENWASVRDNRLFTNFSRFLGLIVAVGLCQSSSLTFTLKGYRIWEPDLKVIHGTALDIFDAALTTVTFFVEKMSLCFKNKSIKPFFVDHDAATELDEDYSNLMLWWDLVKNGNLEKVAKISENEFDDKLEDLAMRLKHLLTIKKSFERKVISDKYDRLLRIKNDYITMKISSGIRKAPFCIELFGASSQGKSTCAEQLIDALLTSANLPTDKKYQASYNPGDRYMSNWKTSKLVLLIDDMANDKSQFVEKPPTRVIIDVCNNTPTSANMADLDAKGKTFIEPALCCVTTNVKNLDANVYSNCPSSIQRRMHAIITVKAKPQFQFVVDGLPQGIDSTKVQDHYERTGVEPTFDDLWDLTVEKAVMPQKLCHLATYSPVTFRGKKMVNCSFREVVQYLISQFTSHRQAQEGIVRRLRTRQKGINLCSHPGCNQIQGYCDRHDTEIYEDAEEARMQQDIEQNEPHAWGRTNSAIGKLYNSVKKRISKDIFGIEASLDGACSALVLTAARRFMRHWDWLKCIPTPWIEEPVVNFLFSMINKPRFEQRFWKYSALLWSSAIGITVPAFLKMRSTSKGKYTLFDGCMTCAPLFLGGLAQWNMFNIVQNSFESEIKCRNSTYFAKRFAWGSGLLWSAIAGYSSDVLFRTFLNKDRTYGKASTDIALAVCSGLVGQKLMVKVVEKSFLKDMQPLKSIKSVVQSVQKDHVGDICKAAGIVGFLYAISQVYNTWYKMEPQGNLKPLTQEDIDRRDAERNPWTQVVVRDLPVPTDAANTTSDQLRGLVEKNLFFATFVDKARDTIMTLNALFIKSNVVIVPDHYFASEELECTFEKLNPNASAGRFAAKLSRKQSVKLPDLDLRLCYCCSGGSFKDLTRFLPKEFLGHFEFGLSHRDETCQVTEAYGLANTCATSNGIVDFTGYRYPNLNMKTFKGLCGAPLYSKRRAILAGIHVGGRKDTTLGVACPLTSTVVRDAINELRRLEGTIISGDAENFPQTILDKKIVKSHNIHFKSPLNYMPHDSQIAYFGECDGMSTFRSDVKVTKISEHVIDVMNAPNKYGPPIQNPQYFGWQNCLGNMANPAIPYDISLLTVAIKDYKADLIPLIDSNLWRHACPLTEQENMCGVMGKKFMDAIKLNTSIGFPLTGIKREFVTETMDEETQMLNREFNEEIRSEIDRCEQCYARSERAYTIAKACKKDEVLSKPKCRIFFGNSIALTFLVRKYFLPILRFMQMNPIVSECAVGINSHGPEWDQFHKHVVTHGKDRLIGGDYSKYDQLIPSQLLFASLRILIDLAKYCDYSDQDLKIMEAMTGDLVYAVIAFNGDLIGLTEGSHISGNSLTVLLNGICGSLNLRIFYYHMYPEFVGKENQAFRKNVAIMTYGDDNLGSVARPLSKFTIAGISEFLGKHGQVYTMPDKESELLDYLPSEDFEFLKRKSVYHKDLDCTIGALVEDSIFKMLHCYLRPKNSPLTEEHATALNIDTALREWFNHGRVTYEKRRQELKEVALRSGLTHLCNELNLTYDDRVQHWKDTYS